MKIIRKVCKGLVALDLGVTHIIFLNSFVRRNDAEIMALRCLADISDGGLQKGRVEVGGGAVDAVGGEDVRLGASH